MKGCRPLTHEEAELVAKSFRGRFAIRDRALFLLGCKTGYRVSELISLRIGDVVQAGRVVDAVYVARGAMKGQVEGRAVPLNPVAKQAIRSLLHELRGASDDSFLFRSRKGANEPISRFQAHRVLKAACCRAGLTGKLGTHTMRKTFANKVYDRLGGDLVKVQRAMGHRNINSTVAYLSFRQEDIDEAILSI